MAHTKKALMIILLVPVLLMIGCGGPEKKEAFPAPVDYQLISIDSPEFAKLNQEDFADWYQDNYKVAGLHILIRGEDRFVLLSAGEKATGGYYLENLTLTGQEKSIEVKAQLHKPEKGDIVTLALTYPHLLFKIKDDGRELVFSGIEGDVPPPEIKIDTGKFLGQIDSNSIEIQVSGVPDQVMPGAFQLGDILKETISQLNLQPGDKIRFSYLPRENNRPVIFEIEKI